MNILVQADWAFGIFWALFTGLFYVIASVFVLGHALDFQFILTNIALWSAAGIVMAMLLGLRRRHFVKK